MFIEILLAITLGVASGIFTGLTPGIHINLISAIIVSLSAALLGIVSPLTIVIFIISMSITHTFLDSIPSIYLGAPDGDMILSALPGHQMLLEGKGHIAIMLTVVGGIGGLFLSILLFPLVLVLLKPFSQVISSYIALILIALLFFLFLREKKRFMAFCFFALSGVAGFTIFALPLSQPLLPTLSGLFGVSLLFLSLFEVSVFPKQLKKSICNVKKSVVGRSLGLSIIVGFFAAFLPGFGASQAAIYASMFLRNASKEIFLILSGAINTIAMSLSLATFIILQKARNGSIIAVSEFIPSFNTTQVMLVCVSMLLVGSCASILTIRISKLFVLVMQKVNYALIVSCVICLLMVLVFVFDGFLGLLVLFSTTCFGICAQKLNISKHYLLGCLLIPTILYLL